MNGIANLGFQTQQPHQSHTQRFIPFSANTTGKCGRPVFIDAKLLPDFIINIDINTHRGRQTILRIEQLRATGGGINAFQSTDRAAKHMSLVDELEVYYYITQEGSAGSPNGLYITNIKKHQKSVREKGLYTIANDQFSETFSERFTEPQVCISSGSSLGSAMQKAELHIDKDGWGKTPKYQMFFIPSALINTEGRWIGPSQKSLNEEKITKELNNIIHESQTYLARSKSEEKIRIRVFDEASDTLERGLDNSNISLDKLGFELIDPTSSAVSLLKKLNRKDARLSPNAIKITNHSSALKLSSVRAQLSRLLNSRGLTKNANQVLGKTESSDTALSVGKSISRQSANFMSAVRQASLLSQWASK